MLARLLGALAVVVVGCGAGTKSAVPPEAPALCTERATHQGDLVLMSDLEVEAAAACRRVTGNLVIREGGVTQLDALALTHVAGDVRIGPAMRLTSAAGLATLQEVGGSVVVTQSLSLGGLYLRGLSALGKDLIVHDNNELGVVSVPKVAVVSGNVTITKNPALTRVGLLGTREIRGRFTLSDNALLADVMIVSLQRIVGGVTSLRNPKLTKDALAPHLGAPDADVPATDK